LTTPERTKNGLLAARKEGRVGGRRPKLTLRQQLEIVQLVDAGQKTAADAARLFNVLGLQKFETLNEIIQKAYST